MLDTCSRFTAMALGVDTVVDRGPADARRRAALQFGTPALLEQIAGEGRDHTWDLLAEHRARVQASLTPIDDDPPPMRSDQAAGGVIATRVAVGANEWRQTLPGVAVYCTVVPAAAGWKVAAVTFSDVLHSGPSQ